MVLNEEAVMPLLPLESFLFPDALFENETPFLQDDACWWVMHTKPRTEKTLARNCVMQEISFYLPIYEHRWHSQGRMRQAYLPLFPGYVFVRGDEQARLAALKTRLVVSCLPVPDQQELHDDLSRLHRLLTSGALVTPEDRLSPGMWVEITSGPLMGLTGKILRRGGRSRFVVEVEFLQRGVSAEVEGWTLQPIEPPQLLTSRGA
jgi:transcriptional antiterminator RfaH